MPKLAPCLWFDSNAEEAVNFYVSTIPDSRIDHIQRNPSDGPSGKAGSVLMIAFTLAGAPYLALNGGIRFDYTHAISLALECDDQAQLDRVWDALLQGGTPEQCGWLKDRHGVSWQIVPSVLPKLIGGPDAEGAKRAMAAMMGMVKLDGPALQRAYDGG